jgi:hypothetical protein
MARSADRRRVADGTPTGVDVVRSRNREPDVSVPRSASALFPRRFFWGKDKRRGTGFGHSLAIKVMIDIAGISVDFFHEVGRFFRC